MPKAKPSPTMIEAMRHFGPIISDFIPKIYPTVLAPRRWGKTAAMRSLLDHPSVTFDRTIFPIVHLEEIPMKATPIQKLRIAANNAGAMFRAKEAQHLRLIEKLQADIAGFAADNTKLDAAGKRVAALLEDRDNQIKALRKDIETFKLEALQLTTELATMRGYVCRTLEDDAVREGGATKEAKPLPEGTLWRGDNMPETYVPDLRRTGPFPPVFVGMDMSSNNNFESLYDRPTRAAHVVTHWLNR